MVLTEARQWCFIAVDFRLLHIGLQGHDGRRLLHLPGLEHKHGLADDRVFDHVHTVVFRLQSVHYARTVYAGGWYTWWISCKSNGNRCVKMFAKSA